MQLLGEVSEFVLCAQCLLQMCTTRPLISLTRSGVSNDSERRGDATTKHDVVVPPIQPDE